MTDEKLIKANGIRHEIARIEKMLGAMEKNASMEITFSNGGYRCCNIHSDYITDEEIAEIKNRIVNLIRTRAQSRLDQLQTEFDNL